MLLDMVTAEWQLTCFHEKHRLLAWSHSGPALPGDGLTLHTSRLYACMFCHACIRYQKPAARLPHRLTQVASVSGDVRRALELCRKAAELLETRSEAASQHSPRKALKATSLGTSPRAQAASQKQVAAGAGIVATVGWPESCIIKRLCDDACWPVLLADLLPLSARCWWIEKICHL